MKVILWKPDYTGWDSPSGRATLALAEGLKKLGVDHEVLRAKDITGDVPVADIAVVNGWLKDYIDGRPAKNRCHVIRAQQAAGKPTFCIERGFLLDREEWSGFSIDGFCSNGGDFRAEGMPSDRWDSMGIELQPWRTEGDYILLCAQVPWDAQVQEGNHLEWLESTALEIRKHTERPIVFRGHPKAWRRVDPYLGLPGDPWREMGVRFGDLRHPPPTSFEEDLAGAHAVVCFNSNVATLATIAGVPVFTGAPCLADPIALRGDWTGKTMWDLLGCMEIVNPLPGVREQWLADLCYKQWSVDEFREGTPWKHLTR